MEENPRNKYEGQIYVAKVAEDFTLYAVQNTSRLLTVWRARASFQKLLLQASKTLNQTRFQQASEAIFGPQTPVNGATETKTSTSSHRRVPTANAPNASKNTSLLTAANDVTIALRRTHALLEQELEKSTLSLDSLNNSSQTLRQLEHQYSAVNVLLRGSRRLITELERADKWDRWMIYVGLAIFGLACLWIVYKRVLRCPLGLVFWASTKALGLSSAFARPWEVVVVGNAKVNVNRLTETGFQEDITTKPLWSEGFEDDTLESMTVTMEIDGTPEIANL
jgi:Sec20